MVLAQLRVVVVTWVTEVQGLLGKSLSFADNPLGLCRIVFYLFNCLTVVFIVLNVRRNSAIVLKKRLNERTGRILSNRNVQVQQQDMLLWLVITHIFMFNVQVVWLVFMTSGFITFI